jgi:hypothetical protein
MAKVGTTRYYSHLQESYVAKLLDGKLCSNSGASKFNCGDIVTKDFLIECKTSMTEKGSFSVKHEVLTKNDMERISLQKPYSALAFNFGPDTDNYFVINEKLMKLLVSHIEGEE